MRPVEQASGDDARRPGDLPPLVAAGIVGVLALSALLRFSWLTADRLWFDEIFSVTTAIQDLPALLERVLADETNPPGFYLLLAAWVRLGDVDEGWLRTLPAIAGTLTPLATILAGRALGLRWSAAILGGALAACSPLLISLSVEVRAYSLVALLATLALAQSAALARGTPGTTTGQWMALGVLHLALVMLHYFGLLTVLALTLGGAWVARADRSRPLRAPLRFALAALPAIGVLAAWMLVVSRAAGAEVGENASWIDPPSIHSLPRFAASAIGAFGDRGIAWGLFVLLCGVVVGALWRMRRRAERAPAADALAPMLVGAALVPVVLALGASLLTGHSFWLARYLTAVLPALLLLVAQAADRTAPAVLRTGIVALLLGWAVLAGAHSIGARARKPDWPRLIAELTRNGPAQACVSETYVQLPLAYYALQEGLPLSLARMSRCAPVDGLTWAVYRPETAAALGHLTDRRATLGPRFSLLTELPPLDARAVRRSR